jgi:hypothetical protein
MTHRFQPGEDRSADAILAIVGITADRSKRRWLKRFLQEHAGLPVFVPPIPYCLGFRFSSRWLEWYLRSMVLTKGYRRAHVLAYIGGGFLLRLAARRWSFLRFGRILYDRSPIQEAVAPEILRRTPRLVLRLTGNASVIDLASEGVRKLPFPSTELEQGLVIETEASRLARRLRLRRESVPASAWQPETLLPGANAVKELPLSHDEVYGSEAFLSEALAFLETGHFLTLAGESAKFHG